MTVKDKWKKPPVEEPKGYQATAGWVKSRPENNDYYVEQFSRDPWYPAIKAAHDALTALMPGYNISQIKDKFGGLRYYIGTPEGTSLEVKEQAYRIIRTAEKWVDDYEARKREEKND